jgi:hypothetical protein
VGSLLACCARDFAFKRGHLKAVESYRLAASPLPSAAADEVGEPAGTTLDDGSTIQIHEDRILGSGGGGLVLEATMTRRSGALAHRHVPPHSTSPLFSIAIITATTILILIIITPLTSSGTSARQAQGRGWLPSGCSAVPARRRSSASPPSTAST